MNRETKQLIRNIQRTNDRPEFIAMKIGMILNPIPTSYRKSPHGLIDISKIKEDTNN